MAVKRQKNRTGETGSWDWPFGPKNYIVFGFSLIAIILGFVLLDAGDITWAPILLVLGFCVLVPTAIIIDGIPKDNVNDSTGLDE